MSGTPTQQRIGDVLVALDHRVVTATIDRPEKRNAISLAVIDGLDAAIDTAIATDAGVFVLRGAGEHFCAGADLGLIRSSLDDAALLADFIARISEICDRLAAAPFVSIAAVSGCALAGGCELLLACDLAVASRDAQIGDRHLQNSMLPGAGGSVRLLRALGPARARRLLYTAEMISGERACDRGLVCEAVPGADLDAHVAALVDRLRSQTPAALATMKQMIVSAAAQALPEALAAERRIFLEYAGSNDQLRGALTAFLSEGAAASRS